MLVYISLYVQICKINPMGRIVVELDEELENAFRNEIARRLGMKKGNIKIAIEEAIKTWIEKDRQVN
jgi:hypothetical protein